MGDFEEQELAYIKTIAPKVIEINKIGGYWQEIKCETLLESAQQEKCKRIHELSNRFEKDYEDLKNFTKTCEMTFQYSMMDAQSVKDYESCMEKVKVSLSNFVNIYHTSFTEA